MHFDLRCPKISVERCCRSKLVSNLAVVTVHVAQRGLLDELSDDTFDDTKRTLEHVNFNWNRGTKRLVDVSNSPHVAY